MESWVGAVVPFDAYVSSIEDMAEAALRSAPNNGLFLPSLSDVLDGQAAIKLRETVPLWVRKEQGAFFSNSNLRAAAIVPWYLDAEPPVRVLDPAVGAGDLLVEVARHLPVDKDLSKTLYRWGLLLHGRDVESAFVRLARARLVLLAVSRGSAPQGEAHIQLDEILPGIRVGDSLDLVTEDWRSSHIVMNPPFTYREAPQGVTWARGRTNLAAMFLARVVECAQPGTRVTAILPDVIRTGSRYERLRQFVTSHLDISAIEPYGQFDTWTDVDVFILRGVVRDGSFEASSAQWWHREADEELGDRFTVRVGSVVPHRDPESEALHPYLHARAIPLGGDFDVSCAEQRGFQKRLFHTPFVVVRRTSRPGDKSRGIGTIISGSGEVLVENHLIVLQPKNGSKDTCQHVVDLLASTHAKQWLDDRIRCRHLTVQALKEMPWV